MTLNINVVGKRAFKFKMNRVELKHPSERPREEHAPLKISRNRSRPGAPRKLRLFGEAQKYKRTRGLHDQLKPQSGQGRYLSQRETSNSLPSRPG